MGFWGGRGWRLWLVAAARRCGPVAAVEPALKMGRLIQPIKMGGWAAGRGGGWLVAAVHKFKGGAGVTGRLTGSSSAWVRCKMERSIQPCKGRELGYVGGEGACGGVEVPTSVAACSSSVLMMR